MFTAHNTMKKKNLAAILCITLIFATLFSFFFIIEEANHHCSGQDCPVCACIHQAERTLRSLDGGVFHQTVFMPFCAYLLLIPAFQSFCLPAVSLVSQKVRLND